MYELKRLRAANRERDAERVRERTKEREGDRELERESERERERGVERIKEPRPTRFQYLTQPMIKSINFTLAARAQQISSHYADAIICCACLTGYYNNLRLYSPKQLYHLRTSFPFPPPLSNVLVRSLLLKVAKWRHVFFIVLYNEKKS